jgi:HK97 family phage prohead protease
METPESKGHITLKAATAVSTDEGVFEAVISTATVDREKDIVDTEAMVKALRKWNEVGKLIPLAWNHSTKAEDIVGDIKPESVKSVGDEVVAEGWIDQSTEVGNHAWRLVKSGTLGFSFGYMVTQATKRKGGGLHITELDVFEVTATPTPMNHDTRVLGWKSTQALEELVGKVESLTEEVEGLKAMLKEREPEETESVPDPLKERSRQTVAEIRQDGAPERKSPDKGPEPVPEQPSDKELQVQWRDMTMQLLRGT